MPGRSGCAGSSSGTAIRTGTRCTTLVKLPLALSGGSRAKRAPVAGLRRLHRALEPDAAVGIDAELDRIADLHRLQFRLLQVGRHPDLTRRDDRQQGLARLHQFARLDPAARDDPGDRCRDDGVAELCLGRADGGGRGGEPRIGAPERSDAGRHLALRGNRLAPGDIEVGDGGIVRRLRRIQLLCGNDLRRRETAIALEIGGGLPRRRFRRGHRSLSTCRLGLHRGELGGGLTRVAPAARLGLRRREVSARLLQAQLEVARVEHDQRVTGLHHLVVLHQHPANEGLHLRRDRRDVAIDLRIVTGDHEPAREPGADAPCGRGRHDEEDYHEPSSRTSRRRNAGGGGAGDGRRGRDISQHVSHGQARGTSTVTSLAVRGHDDAERAV